MYLGASEASPYDPMAHAYDLFYNAALNDRNEEAAVVAGLCKVLRPDAQSLLDLGSGTGMIMRQLAQAGGLETLVGVEQSAGMIEQARRNFPEGEFVQGDIRDFTVDRQFDVVTCLFDTINHLPAAEDWEKTFDGAAAHLKPGGIFLFDMVTHSLLQRAADLGPDNSEFDGGRCRFAIEPIPEAANQYAVNVKVTPDDETQPAASLEIVETVFDPRHVLVSLKKYLRPELIFDHVKAREALDADTDFWPPVTPRTTRIMIVASKPDQA